MTALTHFVFGWLTFAVAPVPPEPPPDPLGKGYLGITVSNESLAVSEVQPGLPASKAGLRPGDVITRVGNHQPRVFQEVVSQICSYRPGAVIEVEVQRGKERKIFQVKLTSRPADLDSPGRLPGIPVPIGPDD
jgi:S1-C subfamily serine protease